MDFLNVSTTPISGQRPGTSGLRKQSATAALSHYIENFVQSTVICRFHEIL
jgi:phosphoglucomutase